MNLKKSKLKEILLEKEWGTGTLLPILLGVVVFSLISLFGGKTSYALFWGMFSTYMLFGAFISVSKSKGLFEKINIGLGVALVVAGILGLIFWSEVKIIGTPTLIIGIAIAVMAFLGLLSKWLGEGMSYLDDY